MNKSDIKKIYYNGNEVISLYWGGNLIYTNIAKIEEHPNFVRAEGEWIKNANSFTSNPIGDKKSTIEKLYFKNLGGKQLNIIYDISSEPGYDYLEVYDLDSETTINKKCKTSEVPSVVDKNGNYITYGTLTFEFPDDEEHFIKFSYKKDSSTAEHRDNVILYLPLDTFNHKWKNIDTPYTINEKENGVWYESKYQKQQAYIDNEATDEFKRVNLISKIEVEKPNILAGKISYLGNKKNNCCFWLLNATSMSSPKTYLTEYYDENSREFEFVYNETLESAKYLFYTLLVEEFYSLPDMSSINAFDNMFFDCNQLKTFDFSLINTKDIRKLGYTFYNCRKLESINFGKLDFSNADKDCFCATFTDCISLKYVTGEISGIKDDSPILLSYSPLINASAMVFINGLGSSTNTPSITFKSTTYDTLTEEQIALATSKGWSVIRGS